MAKLKVVIALAAAVERAKAAAAQVQELAARDATIERQALQDALDRQLDKYTELKAVVGRLKPAAR